MRRRAVVVGGVSLVMLGALGWWAARAVGGTTARAAASAASAPTVLEFTAREVVTAQRLALPSVVEFSGTLVAPGTAVLRAKAPGRLLSLAVVEGQRVRAGQVLGQIDQSELASRLREREAAAEAAQAQFTLAERQHRANEGLAAQQFIAPTALETSLSQMNAARAQWHSARAQLDTLRLAQRDATLTAPIAGIVAKRQVLPGEQLAVEQAVLTIVDLARLELAGLVGTHEVARLRPGLPVQVRVEGHDEPAAARIERIAPAAEPGTRSIGVTVALPNPGERYRAGPYAVARVVLDDATPRLTLPATALTTASGQDHVWTLEAGQLMRRAVTTGRRDAASGRVELLAGLPEGVPVLLARFDNLREGAPARVRGDAPAVSPASAGNVASPARASAPR